VRDLVEIGMGREARRTYQLDDVDIVPSRRTRSSKEVSTAWQLDAYRFDIPVLAHPTDALVSPAFAIELGKQGGLGVINGEGLWARHADVQAKLDQLIHIAETDLDPEAITPGTCEMTWPPRSGRVQEFPEIDRVRWVQPDQARRLLVAAQVAFVDRLVDREG
jgi:IMP dehydrogenase